jgi:hypothetical protein
MEEQLARVVLRERAMNDIAEAHARAAFAPPDPTRGRLEREDRAVLLDKETAGWMAALGGVATQDRAAAVARKAVVATDPAANRRTVETASFRVGRTVARAASWVLRETARALSSCWRSAFCSSVESVAFRGRLASRWAGRRYVTFNRDCLDRCSTSTTPSQYAAPIRFRNAGDQRLVTVATDVPKPTRLPNLLPPPNRRFATCPEGIELVNV